MNSNRVRLYKRLQARIGNTPLVESPLQLPNGNKLFIKEEYKNPTGSHYDRVYVHLLNDLEKRKKIKPGETPLIETTSGNAGASFAWLCRELGYEATVILPEGLPIARINDIKQYGAKLMFTPKKDYIGGSAKELKRILTEVNRQRHMQGLPMFRSPNHSQTFKTIDSLESIATEATDQLNGKIDFFIAAIGNGASLLGPGKYLKKQNSDIQIIGWEPLASGLACEMKYPGSYRNLFGISKGQLTHELYGTGVSNVKFPFLEQAIEGKGGEPIVDEVMLVTDTNTENQLRKKIDPQGLIDSNLSLSPGGAESPVITRRRIHVLNTRRFPNWEKTAEELSRLNYQVGRSSAASMAVAFNIASREKLKFKWKFPFVEADKTKGKNFLVIAYDPLWKYNNVAVA